MAWVHPPAIGCRFSFLHLPCGRCGHTMSVYKNSLIVFGGYDGKKWLCDLYSFDVNSLVWSKPDLTGCFPQPRQYHAAQIIDDKLYIYGGYNGTVWLKDFVIADLKEMKWKFPETRGNQPTAKEGLAMAAIGKYLFVHGGWNGTSNGDLHRFDTTTDEWTLVKIEGFKPLLCGHSMTVVNEKLFVFGGFDGVVWVNNLYIIDPFKNNTWTEPTVYGSPVARGYHSAVLYNKHILVYAGYNGKYILADIVALDIETLTWFLPDTCSGHFPAARNAHTMVLHSSQLYLFGGYNGSRDTNELHILETSAFSSLHEDFKQIFTTNLWQDILLYNSSSSYSVHSIILKSRAPVLYSEVLHIHPNFLETRNACINIGSGSPEGLKLFCEYLYCDISREKITNSVAEELLYLAFKFNIPRLKALCLKVIYERNETIPDSVLSADIMKCKDDADLSDFSIIVKDTVFKVHKIVIAARCQYFKVMLNSGMRDSRRNSIVFHDLNPKAFEIIIEWMYSDKFLPLFNENSLDLEIGKDLLNATNFLQLESLMRITEITLWKLIDSTNAFRMFSIACMFSTSQLKSYCINYILRQFDKFSIQRELELLDEDVSEELKKFLPKRVFRSKNSITEPCMVKYEKEDEVVNNEPVMISGHLFQSLKITKKMTIKANNSSISDTFISNSSLCSNFRSPTHLKIKPRLQLNVWGIKPGGGFISQDSSTKESLNNKRKPRSYKNHTLMIRDTKKMQEKPEFFIKGFGSCRRGKSRMNSLVSCSIKRKDILTYAGLQIYSSVNAFSTKNLFPEIKK